MKMKISKKLYLLLFLLSPYLQSYLCPPGYYGGIVSLVNSQPGYAPPPTCLRWEYLLGIKIIRTFSSEIRRVFNQNLSLSLLSRVNLAIERFTSELFFPMVIGIVFATLSSILWLLVKIIFLKYRSKIPDKAVRQGSPF